MPILAPTRNQLASPQTSPAAPRAYYQYRSPSDPKNNNSTFGSREISVLKKSALGWPKIAGLGIALVVAGQFSGWNFGLMAGGWLTC